MDKRILLCIDAEFSPATRRALQAASSLLEQSDPRTSVLLIHVIPLLQTISPHPGIYAAQVAPTQVASWQRDLAEEVLQKAREKLLRDGIAASQIESVVRSGIPAEVIAKEASAFHVQLIVIGSRGDSLWHRLRRIVLGSISRRVMQLAPCPVLVAAPPCIPQPTDLVAWYEQAITRYLHEHTSALAVFTSRQVVEQFLLPNDKRPGRKELAAATLALERLAQDGVLCRHDVKGELLYVND